MKRYRVLFFLAILMHCSQYAMRVTMQDLAFDHRQESKYCITLRAPKDALQHIQTMICALNQAKLIGYITEKDQLFIFGGSDHDIIDLLLALDMHSIEYNRKSAKATKETIE